MEMQAKIEIEQMKVEVLKLEAAANLEETKLRYMAETQRTHSNHQISNADNLTKIILNSVKEKRHEV